MPIVVQYTLVAVDPLIQYCVPSSPGIRLLASVGEVLLYLTVRHALIAMSMIRLGFHHYIVKTVLSNVSIREE